MKLPASLVQTRVDGPLGPMVLAASAQGLAGVWFVGQQHFPPQAAEGAQAWAMQPEHPVLQAATAQLADYMAGQRQHFDLPLDLSYGTAFQQAVWQALLGVTVGQTCSYTELAQRAGHPQAVRAVGAAIGRNPLSVVVPCHRVVGANGALTGYAGGLAKKSALLALERAQPEPRA